MAEVQGALEGREKRFLGVAEPQVSFRLFARWLGQWEPDCRSAGRGT